MNEKIPETPEVQAFAVRDVGLVCLYTFFLLAAVTVMTGRMSVILILASFVVSVGRGPLRRLRERLSVALAGFIGFAFMNGFAAIYALDGGNGLKEFNKFAASFALAAVVLTRFDRKHIQALLWGLITVCAIIGLICVDMGGWEVLFDTFNSLMQDLGTDYTDVMVNTTSQRMNGIYNDANITGAIMSLAVFVGLYLEETSKLRLWRFLASLLYGVCAVAFLTAASRGAIAFFCLSSLVYLAAARKNRLRVFLRLLAAAVSMLGVGGTAIICMEQGSFVPDLLCFACGAVFFILEEFICTPIVARLEGKGKVVAIGCGAIVAVMCVVVVVALNWMGPLSLTPEGWIMRSIQLPAGEYTFEGDWDKGSNVVVSGRSHEDSLMNHWNMTLYEGPLDGAEFTVPETATRLSLRISNESGGVIRALSTSDGTPVPLHYKLLPELIAVRLHDGLFESYSFLVRMQYDIDGWKLFHRSPLLGLGLGSTETWLTSLQPFFYESLFLHNHILQVLCDMGIAGLMFWLAFLGGVLWLLLRRLREESDSLAAMLLACWVMMVTHGLMEIDFSIRSFQCVAWLLLLLPVVAYTKPMSQMLLVRWGGIVASVLLSGYLLVFGGLLLSRRIVQREMDTAVFTEIDEFMQTTKRWIKMDVFDHTQNQLNFVGSAVQLDDARYFEDMDRYAKELRSTGTYLACTTLAEYYYLPRGEYDEMFACSREGVAQEASVSAAWDQEFDFYRYIVLPNVGEENVDVYVDGVLALRDQLEVFSEGRIEDIRLSDENLRFIESVENARKNEMEGAGALMYLMLSGGLLQQG